MDNTSTQEMDANAMVAHILPKHRIMDELATTSLNRPLSTPVLPKTNRNSILPPLTFRLYVYAMIDLPLAGLFVWSFLSSVVKEPRPGSLLTIAAIALLVLKWLNVLYAVIELLILSSNLYSMASNHPQSFADARVTVGNMLHGFASKVDPKATKGSEEEAVSLIQLQERQIIADSRDSKGDPPKKLRVELNALPEEGFDPAESDNNELPCSC